MRLTFHYVPVARLDAAVTFYRETLGLVESWREGDDTVAFTLDGTEVELMLGEVRETDGFAWFTGPMYEVDLLAEWEDGHPDVTRLGPVSHTPPVHVLPCADVDGNGFYVYELDRPDS